MVEIDLNTKILPAAHEVYLTRPGSKYRFYIEFIEFSRVFLDLPGLNLIPGRDIRSYSDLEARIHRARAVKNWYKRGGESDRPTDDLAHYAGFANDAGIGQIRSAIYGYFERAKKGDLAIVPCQSFQNLVYIGEFVGDPTDIVEGKSFRHYDEMTMPGRQVKWVGRIEKRFLNSRILNIIAAPNIFVPVPKHSRKEIYELCYGGYTIDGDYSVRFDVSSHEFTAHDDLVIQSFFNFVSYNTSAIAEGKKFLSYKEAAFADAGAYTPDLRTDVSSPGFLNLSSAKITPLVAAALFTIAVDVGAAALQAAENGTLRIGNSQAASDDACVADVEAQAINQIKLSGAIDWPEACERAKQAAKRNGIKGPAKIKR